MWFIYNKDGIEQDEEFDRYEDAAQFAYWNSSEAEPLSTFDENGFSSPEEEDDAVDAYISLCQRD